ncbi:MAG: hypothetical protein BJ554DRAFT_6951 [Olpidium bornovanus]|uniref:Uncharacterized protein n=1 Tax=Olpidium bornovanus TaxID=278681 RepID=A0A8H8DJR0_9FUNG|nr:MAG: hypothetical protein BJ554DRAFT_6951 [Olpidium bornovanus]
MSGTPARELYELPPPNTKTDIPGRHSPVTVQPGFRRLAGSNFHSLRVRPCPLGTCQHRAFNHILNFRVFFVCRNVQVPLQRFQE